MTRRISWAYKKAAERFKKVKPLRKQTPKGRAIKRAKELDAELEKLENELDKARKARDKKKIQEIERKISKTQQERYNTK